MKINQYRLIILCSIILLYSCRTVGYVQQDPTNIYEKLLLIDGVEFRIKSYGIGEVTVIFESGIALPLETWSSIDSACSNFANVFLYDRAGIGHSSLSSNERTIPNYVDELKNILENENLQPPYLLVSHSMGGYIARYFVSKYPEDVCGMLLIDPAPEKLYDSLSGKELRQYIDTGDVHYAKKNGGSRLEWESFYDNRVYMYELAIPNSIPVTLLSSTEGNMTVYQEKIVENHQNTKLIMVEGSHYYHNEHPEVIVDYILELLTIAKD